MIVLPDLRQTEFGLQVRLPPTSASISLRELLFFAPGICDFHVGVLDMSRHLIVLLIFIRLLIWDAACHAQTNAVESIGALNDAAVSDAVRKEMELKGYRIVLEDGKPAYEIWLRKSIPTSDRKDDQGALYPPLAPPTLVGVISYVRAGTDYRGQAIRPGYYTLRYQWIPTDGDHLGVSPNPDFLLLVPAAVDADPTASPKFADLVGLSRKATGSKHPGLLSLVQAGSAVPGISKDDQGHSVFSVKLTLASGKELPIGLIVKGTAPQ